MTKKVLTVIFITFSIGVYSQTYIEDVTVMASGVGVHENELDSIWRQYLWVRLSDTLFIEKVHVKIGSTEGGSDFFSEEYDFNGTNELTSPQAFERQDNYLKIILGDDIINEPFYYEVSLEDFDENLFSKYFLKP